MNDDAPKNAPNAAGQRANWRVRTRLVHEGTRRSQYGETSEAMFLTQGFVYPDAEAAEARFKGELAPGEEGFIYARYGNPTVAMFEDRIAALEGAEAAFATASGMAAVHAALMCQLKAGDHVVAARALFGSCLYIVETLCPRFGIDVTLVDGTDLDQWRAAMRPETRLLFLESPSNPTLEVIDIGAVAEIGHQWGARLVVDNVFATPLFQRPLALGADVVVYSATKHIDGQGRCLGGVICGSERFIRDEVEPFVKHTGPALSPFNAWVMLKSLETLPLRVHAQTDGAEILARHLDARAREGAPLGRVIYPGLPSHPQHNLAARQMERPGQMVAFEIAGGQAGAFRFLNALGIVAISNNLGDTKSLITHPSTTTHQRLSEAAREHLGIAQGLVRLSVGLEDPEDLREDIDRALARV
ncbi:O-succinylhomoserine sulfhydrylase [Limibaculum sp. M0105]|uniref:O-succinylhomoserine sulfhydrylase n=1 Tax=Thermohalobaculum xanthum TaxID=2753746 RepID=A0A8J7M6S2_9RHOB|nr:O-succinylhomoserine sulfhydrylase [Thermohalobaculum xanthum]MBK0399323.1 O-succinylhomoserine sulfhydrylase [Thermohalobaculum xanthum]